MAGPNVSPGSSPSPSPGSTTAGLPGWWPLALCFHLAFLLNWGGVALQSGAIYLFALIAPLTIWYYRGQRLASELPKVAAGLALLWLIFPIGNLLIWGLDELWGGFILVDGLSQVDDYKKLTSSHTPSTVIVTAVILAVAAWLFHRRPATARAPSSYQPLWRQVFIGYSVTVLIVAGYLIAQHLTGFDIRAKTGHVGMNNMMPSGLFRVKGFYGHTLSLASNALALAVFFAVLAIRLSALRLASQSGRWNWQLCTWLAMVMVGFIYLAGSRTVMVAAIVMAVAIAVAHAGRWRPWLIGAIGLSLAGIVAAALILGVDGLLLGLLSALQALPGGERFAPLVAKVQNGDLAAIPRLVFWRTHWQMIQDAPILGHGYAYMSETTQVYYRQLGLGDYFRRYNAHNVYLQFIAETGVVGVVALAATLRYLWVNLRVWGSRCRFRRAWLTALAWSLTANAVHGLTQNTFFDANVIAVYILLLSVVVWLPVQPPTNGVGR